MSRTPVMSGWHHIIRGSATISRASRGMRHLVLVVEIEEVEVGAVDGLGGGARPPVWRAI